MIIGKSLTALGGGGLKPEITVTAKAGALLNLHYKDSSIILQTYHLGAEETQHTFVASVSETAYVVEDVTNNSSIEILVDVVARYEVTMKYPLILYSPGNNYGGFFASETAQTWAFQVKDECIYMYAYYNAYGSQSYVFSSSDKKVSVSDFSKLCIEISSYTSSGNEGGVTFGISNGQTLVEWVKSVGIPYNISNSTYEVDISDNSGDFYVKILLETGWYGKDCTLNITKIWLE